MMNVANMAQAVNYVDVGATPGIAPTAAVLWNYEIGSLQYVRSSANHIFSIKANEQPLFLRLAPAEEKEMSLIAAELDFVNHVAKCGVAVARPVPSVERNLIEPITSNHYSCHAVAFEALPGNHCLDVSELTDKTVRSWGQTVAALHTASRSYKPAANLKRLTWEDYFASGEKYIHEKEFAVIDQFKKAKAWMQSLSANSRNFGLIHSDVELDNMMWDGKRFQVMDFDDCHYNWYTADIAGALMDLWSSKDLQRTRKINLFLKAYRDANPKTEIDEADIPKFIRVFQLWKFTRTAKAYHNTDPRGYAPWLTIMHRRHLNKMAEWRAEFEKKIEW